MYKSWKRICSLALSLLLALSAVPAMAAPQAEESPARSWEQIPNDSVAFRLGAEVPEDLPAEPSHAADERVRVSIELETPPTLERYAKERFRIAESTAATAYRNSLRSAQNALAARISAEALGGAKLDVVWNLTLAANIISANVRYGDIAAIRDVVGVKAVFLENRFEPQRAMPGDEPMMSVATEMTGVQQVWSTGYTGAGSIVAVVDTGLDTGHQSFDEGAFNYAIAELKATRTEAVKLMTQADVEGKLSQLNAKTRMSSVKASDLYRTTKIPFAFNYVDSGLDVTHENDTQGEHGSHVSGIATANRYIPDGNGGYRNALDAVYTQGDAPDAQLLVMKVFGSKGGAYDSDYFAAIEDAIVLGADVVNLSLGSSVPGMVSSPYQDKVNAIADSSIVWANSAGNSYAWASFSNSGYLYADDVSFSTGGSPGTFENALSVASVDNKGFTGEFLTVGDRNIFFNESAGYGNDPIRNIAGEHRYVLIDGFGSADEWEDIPLSGAVAVCSRGVISFYEKANSAVDKGAVAVIIYNNAPGTIGMNLTGYEKTAPVVSVTQADGGYMKSQGTKKTSPKGLTYYEGSITVASGVAVNNPGDVAYYEMSDFSSWGVPGDLSLKPEITAPGGNIYSVFGTNQTSDGTTVGGTDQYENMSGTSMASPQIAGLTAVLAQYLREENVLNKVNGARQVEDSLTQRQLMQSLMMSTAVPLREEASGGEYYSILKQGAGLIDLEAAVNARSYVMMDASATKSAADGKIKVELGDDPDRENNYSATFTLYNFADEAQSFSLSADFFTQDVFDYEGAEYLDYWTTPLTADVRWTVDGQSCNNALDLRYDFDGNGVVAMPDAQALLDKLTGNRADIAHAETADVDADGDMDSHDVYALIELLNAATVTVPKNGHVTVTANFTLTDIAEYDRKGAYIEGFLYVQEAETADGAFGVTHSIPVLGYYGSWSEPSMVDQGSLLDNWQGSRVEPYVASNASYKESNDKAFLVKDTAGTVRFLGGNPAVPDAEYLPERNAMNAGDTLSTVRYTLIRNAVGSRLTVTGADGTSVIDTKTRKDTYSSFFSLSSGAWNYAYSAAGINFQPGANREGQRFTATLTLATEYYLKADGTVDWDALYENAGYSVGFTVDSQAPTVDRVDKTFDGEGRLSTLTVTATDNQYIAAVALLNEQGEPFVRGEQRSVYGSTPASTAGTSETFCFDMADYFENLAMIPPHTMLQVYDYAGNLSTWRINLNNYEQATDAPTISLDHAELELIRGKAARLTASVGPWGGDDRVTWTSSDPAIATVSETGIVTAVAEGSCTVTATTVATPAASASCTVTVIDRTLNATIWSAEGKVNVGQFQLSSIPNYEKLSGDLDAGLASAAYGTPLIDRNTVLYAASFDTEEFTSRLYEVNEETYALTEVESFGDLGLGAMDFCAARAMTVQGTTDLLACVYASFVLVIDAKYNGILTSLHGYVDFTDYIVPDADGGMNFLIGIAYAGKKKGSSTVDCIYLLDMKGNLYKTGIKKSGLSFGGLSNAVAIDGNVTLVCNLGYSVDVPYLQSLYYDGTDLYWSRYDSGENDVDLILVRNVDSKSKRQVIEIGSFENDVWPVGGLYRQDEHLKDLTAKDLEAGDGEVRNSASSTNAVPEEVDFQAVRAMLKREYGSSQSADSGAAEDVSTLPDAAAPEAALSEPVGEELPPVPFPVYGSLNAVSVRPQAVTATKAETGSEPAADGIVKITADEADTTNGLFRVSYDPAELELVSHSDRVIGLTSEVLNSGSVTFGFAVKNAESAFAKDGEILELSFKLLNGKEYSPVTVTNAESNNTQPETEQTVFIGNAPGYPVTLDDRSVISKGTATSTLDTDKHYQTGDTFTVTSELACVVAFSTDQGASYQELTARHVDGNTYQFTIPEVNAAFQIGIVLLGDARGDGAIKSNDYTRISRYLAAQNDTSITTNCELDALTWLAADTRKDGNVKSNDGTRLSRYLASQNDPSITTNCILLWKTE